VRRVLAALVLVLLAWPVAGAAAADWGGITPGTTTMDAVRARYGAPTKTASQKVKDREAPIWIYEGQQAPRGMARMTVEFGATTPAGVRPDVVGLLRLEPHRGIFTRQMIVAGWGEPTRVSPTGQPPPMFFYESGLIVSFDAAGQQAESMVLTPPLPPPPSPAPPRR
jgi:hypothetical protein